jgi:Flp pilus assembly protein TadB
MNRWIDPFIDFLAKLNVPPMLVATLAACTVASLGYELFVRHRIAASRAERQLRSFMGDAQDDGIDEQPLDVDSWAYKFQLAGVRVKPEQAQAFLYGGSALLAIAAGLIALAFGVPPLLAAAIGIAGAVAPTLYLNHRVAARTKEIEQALPMALQRIATNIRIYPDVTETLLAVAETLPEGSPLRAEFARTARDLRTRGRQALDEMEARAQLVSPSLATVAFQLGRYAERGSGSFSEAFTRAADNLHHILEGRSKAQAKSAEAMGAIKIIPAMLAVVMIYFMNQPAMKHTFQTPLMQVFLLALAGWMGLGYWFMKGMIEEIG